ncbi:Uncharacterized protein Rs2_27825 [Raphanus sativus]|nr:Uncharacterized protein Rs2_27825 [Raphanus sativus]
MTLPTFQEHSNSLNIQAAVSSGLVAQNVDLSLGMAGAFGGEESDEESNRSKKKMHRGWTFKSLPPPATSHFVSPFEAKKKKSFVVMLTRTRARTSIEMDHSGFVLLTFANKTSGQLAI